MSKNLPKSTMPVEMPEEVIIEKVIEEVAAEVPVYEAVPAVEAITPVDLGNTYIAVEGDSYASIAAEFNTTKISKHQYAQYLYALNGGKAIGVGTEVRIG